MSSFSRRMYPKRCEVQTCNFLIKLPTTEPQGPSDHFYISFGKWIDTCGWRSQPSHGHNRLRGTDGGQSFGIWALVLQQLSCLVRKGTTAGISDVFFSQPWTHKHTHTQQLCGNTGIYSAHLRIENIQVISIWFAIVFLSAIMWSLRLNDPNRATKIKTNLYEI